MAIGTAPVAKPGEPDISLAEKYKLEAAKRMREDGQKQFEDLEFSENERLRGLVDDIWADHNALDALPLPVSENGRTKFLILGAGVGGIVMAVKLIQKGFSAEEMVFLDNAGGVGGTWYWNRYPGLHCDVESYCYLPLLEEMGYMPKHKYSTGVEIRKYLEQLAEKFGLNNRVLFRTQANKLVWNDNEKAWKANVTMHRGPAGRQETSLSFYADHAILANGLFPYAKAPKTPGLAQFAGSLIHTARWNYDITGGSADETFPELSKLKDKVVGIVGTGATAIQAVPQLAKYAKELYVFQRTPSQVFPRNQRATDPEEWHHSIATGPGWQRARAENFARSVTGELEPEKNLVGDVWTKINSYGAIIGTGRFGMITPDKAQEHIDRMLALDAEHTQKARLRIAQTVQDKETAERLKPWYPTWCKRPTFSDEYLDAFNFKNVHLVDTNGAGIDSVTPKGVVANTQEYPLDVLILSTGFRVPASKSDPGLRTGVEIVGRHGRRLADKWQQQGISTLHGCVTHGYPNLFIQGAIQAAASPNWNHIVDVQSEHIASIVAMAHSRAGDRKGTILIEPSVDAEEAWGMIIAQGAAYFAGFSICTPGYLTQEGEAFKMPEPDDHAAMMKKAKEAVWYKGMTDFSRMLEDWRKSGKLEGLEVTVS